MANKLYKVIEGKDLFTIEEDKKDPLIEGILYPLDYVMIVAEEKMGKTILAQQMAANMSSGTPFLDIFNIPKPLKVWYMPNEVRTHDLQDRFIRMNEAIHINLDNIKLIPNVIRFNTKEGANALYDLVVSYGEDKPQVIIIDALYKALKGSLRNDEEVNDFHYVLGTLQKQLNCAIVVIHHMTKPQKNSEGQLYERSDKDTYGSAFLMAGVDHVFWLDRWHKQKDHGDDAVTKFPKDRFLSCNTQRSGNIAEGIRIRLQEPRPLYFIAINRHEQERKIIQGVMAHKNLTMDDLVMNTKIGRSTLYAIVKEMEKEGILDRVGTRPIYYKLKGVL